jgi:hypothetical protein
MKEIQPVGIWYNGAIIQATIFNLTSVNDNLSTEATFLYQLFSVDNIQLTNGNITMDGTDYSNYSSNPTSNDYAYQWGAAKLNLTLV